MIYLQRDIFRTLRRMAFPKKVGPSHLPVEECSGKVAMRTSMRVKFWHRRVRDTVVILEEGNLPHPQFPLCNMLVPRRSLNGSHNITEQYKKGAEWKRWCLAVEEARAVTSKAFSAYVRLLEMVSYLKYLGRVPSAADYDCLEVVKNLVKLQTVSRRMSRITSREGEGPRVSIFFFKSVVQLVLIFVAETWVVTPRMGRVLGGFQDHMAWILMGRLPRRRLDGRW